MSPSPAKCSSVPSCSTTSAADRRVVAPQEAEDLLGLGRLRERREVAQVAEHRRDLAAVAGQHRLAVGARHELRDLGREEPGELAPLALDRLEQPGVRDPDRGLLGEAGRERRLAVGERADLVAGQGEDAADRAVLLDRHADQRAVAARLLARRSPGTRGRRGRRRRGSPRRSVRPVPRRCRGPARSDGRAPTRRAPASRPPRRRPGTSPPSSDVGDAVVGPAEAERRPDHGVEHDLEVERRAAHDREDLVRSRPAGRSPRAPRRGGACGRATTRSGPGGSPGRRSSGR